MDRGDSVLSVLGMARRAGKLTIGLKATEKEVFFGRAAVVVAASDLSTGAKEKLKVKCDEKSVPLITLPFSLEEISSAVGISAGVLGVLDKGFLKAINKKLPDGN